MSTSMESKLRMEFAFGQDCRKLRDRTGPVGLDADHYHLERVALVVNRSLAPTVHQSYEH